MWNLLQSHPDLVSPVLETGQIIYPEWLQKGRLGRVGKRLARRLIVRNNATYLRYIDRRLYEQKMSSLEHVSNRYKNEHDLYTADEIDAARLVTKSVGEDCFLTPTLLAAFPGSRSITVVRNGYAVCEGWMRRGLSPKAAARAYRREIVELKKQQEMTERNLVVKFEECIAEPFREFSRMCQFLELDPGSVGKIRIKAKKMIFSDGSHDVRFAREGQKTWVNPDEVDRYLDPRVTCRQIARLTPDQMTVIRKVAGAAMAHFGYEA